MQYVISAVQFQICIQNRYKLNKKYRKIVPSVTDNDNLIESQEARALAQQSKVGIFFSCLEFMWRLNKCMSMN